MLDRSLRVLKEHALAPLADLFRSVPPTSITFGALLVGLLCALAAANRYYQLALLLWGLNRTLDGVDGVVARKFNQTSDLGGYLDLISDFIVYCTIPIALTYGQVSRLGTTSSLQLWLAVSTLLATYAVNAVGLFHLASILEMRQAGASKTNELTTTTMPDGVIEGTETVIAYTFFIAYPQWILYSFSLFAFGVAVTIVQRCVWAADTLPRLQQRRPHCKAA